MSDIYNQEEVDESAAAAFLLGLTVATELGHAVDPAEAVKMCDTQAEGGRAMKYRDARLSTFLSKHYDLADDQNARLMFELFQLHVAQSVVRGMEKT